MKISTIFKLSLFFILVLSFQDCLSIPSIDKSENNSKTEQAADEIIFYSNGSTFSPVIVLQEAAEVLWIWDDNTTSNSLTPTKDYVSAQLRPNRLKVTPWSAVRRINIGYDAGDGGTNSIEFVNDQKVSQVENINLVAPYLKEWCSSYNKLSSLDFSNFINLETIECYLSYSIANVHLTNTPKLKRACFEDNSLLSLDLSSSSSLEDLRGAVNNFSTVIFPNQAVNLWHICLRSNPQLTNQQLTNNLSQFPKIGELWIWNSNQKGDLIIPQTNLTQKKVSIIAYNNHFSAIDFRGALQNVNARGLVDLRYNKLSMVNISGCIQIDELDLSYNLLASEAIDNILKQVDEYGTNNGTIDLRYNQAPTIIGLLYKANLEARGWVVQTDPNIPVQSISISSPSGNSITSDNGTLQLSVAVLPADATNKSVNWSVVNVTGLASISASGLITAEKNGTVKAVATASDGSGIKGELLITISNQVIPVETVTVSSAGGTTTITSDNGTLQLSVAILPTDATNHSVVWSVFNLTGKAVISPSGLFTAERNGAVLAIAWANDGSGIKGELQITISNQVIPAESITVNSPSGNSISTDNGTIQLMASVLPNDATTKTVIWSVINITGRATINASGLLTAERDGTVKAVATASDGSGIKGELQITIANQIIQVESITVTSPSGNFINTDNGTLQLLASVIPNDATIKTATWSVINLTGKAVINASGLLSAERDGTVKAVATASDGSGIKGELLITISNQVISVESISVNSAGGITTITSDNGTLQLSATVLPAEATNKSVNWSVVNLTGKASINASGLLTAERNGTVKAVTTASDGSGIKGEIQITVSNQIISVESIIINSPSGNSIVTDNGTLQLLASVLPIDATTKTVIWSVINLTGRASINALGLLTAERNGTVKAIATASDGTGIKGELQITISNQIIPVESIVIHDLLKNDTIKGIGISLLLSAVISPLDATIKDVDWSVENMTGKANINMNGLLTTVSPGIIKVIAKSKDESKTLMQKEYKIVIPVGNQRIIDHPEIKIFPNPTSGIIQIKIDQIANEGVCIEIRNDIGQTIDKLTSADNHIEWSLHHYPSGIYFFTITVNKTVSNYKIIKE